MISIDEAKARVWLDDVNAELVQVDSILSKVAAALAEYPEKDSIIEKIYDVGERLKSSWSDLTKEMKKARDYLDEAVNKIAQGAENVLEDLAGLASKLF